MVGAGAVVVVVVGEDDDDADQAETPASLPLTDCSEEMDINKSSVQLPSAEKGRAETVTALHSSVHQIAYTALPSSCHWKAMSNSSSNSTLVSEPNRRQWSPVSSEGRWWYCTKESEVTVLRKCSCPDIGLVFEWASAFQPSHRTFSDFVILIAHLHTAQYSYCTMYNKHTHTHKQWHE